MRLRYFGPRALVEDDGGSDHAVVKKPQPANHGGLGFLRDIDAGAYATFTVSATELNSSILSKFM